MISPYDRDLINDGSELRRKYVDGVIAQFDKFYLTDLLEYNKALQQRNVLLKQFAEQHYFDELSLAVWDEKLVTPGEALFQKRKQFLEEFNPLFDRYYRYLSRGNEQVEINYSSQLEEKDFDRLLKDSVQRDRAIRYTSNGIVIQAMEFIKMILFFK